MEKVTADSILGTLKELISSKIEVEKDKWIEAAFYLVVLRMDEAKLRNEMHQKVAQKKVELKKQQDKPNISAIEIEVQSTDEYRKLKNQERDPRKQNQRRKLQEQLVEQQS